MNETPSRALAELLDRPPLRRLWTLARQKLERYGAVRGSVRLDEPSAAEREAVADLLGLRKVPDADKPLRLQLARLDRSLRASRFAVGLEEAMALFGGELRNLPAERAAEEERWTRFWDESRRQPLVVERPELLSWLEDLERTGLLRRHARGDREGLLDRVLTVLAALPADGERLAVLASRALGDSHALDPGHRVPALVQRALAQQRGRPLPRSAAERRGLWATAGVVCDDLSCDVLVLGLAPPGGGLLHRFLREHAAAGEPVRVTLRQLAGAEDVTLAPGRTVSVCENPAVVAVAADRLGPKSPPLVCLDGNPDTAARVLLRSLVDAGAELRYHGDFDWGGIRIANTLLRTVPFAPWRFTAGDYLDAVENAEALALRDRHPVDADWDVALRPAMEERRLMVEEEAVVESLVADLERLWGPGRKTPLSE